MKMQNNQEREENTVKNWPLNAADRDQDDKDLEKKEAEDEEGSAEWGDVDPAGGPAPSAPGSAV